MKKSLGAKTLACPSPVWCIGSYDKDNKPNVMTASWAGICCSIPPAVSVALRKATYTYQNLIDSQAFTVNIPSLEYLKEADFIGSSSGKDTDKFQVTGLTPVGSKKVHAPYVKEFPLIIECRLIHYHEIGLHTQFIGEIVDVMVDPKKLSENGEADMGRIQPFLFAATDRAYYSLGRFIGNAFETGDYR